MRNAEKTYCGLRRFSIHSQDDSRRYAGQQVVRVFHAPRLENGSYMADFRGSTWQGREIPSVASFPGAACRGSGNRARFRTFGGAPLTANDNSLPVLRRSGSQRRQRNQKIGVGCDAAEFVIIDHNARAAGLSRASYLRALALGSPGPRARRSPPVNAEALAHATAALNKVGSNLNQIARALNAGAATIAANECFTALGEVRAAVARILKIVGRTERL
jgi:hypothetical protein